MDKSRKPHEPVSGFYRDGWFITGNGSSWGAELYGVNMSANSRDLICQMVETRVASDKASGWHHLTPQRRNPQLFAR